MKPINENRTVFSSNNESTSFEISDKDAAHIMGLLRDGLYTDKILAVLREYSANAWDAHRMVGKADVPLQIQIPTTANPVLRIRDFGPGLSHDDVFNVYAKYGASTKRDSNDVVGCFGVGSKSGFAYSDSFTIVSWHDGRKRTYVAVLDESEKGKISLLDDSACDPSETGVEIMIVAKPEDCYEFERKARELFRHFNPRPTINIELPPLPPDRTVLTNGEITGKARYNAEWIAIMGCVPYRVNINQLDLTQVSKCLPHLSGALYFGIGDVQVSASREELKYNKNTKDKLVQKFNDLVDEYVLHALRDLDRPDVSAWDKRLKVQVLRELELPLPGEWDDMGKAHAKLTYAPGTITITHNDTITTSLQVDHRTKLLIDDAGRDLKGYYFGHYDYVVRGVGGAYTPEEIRKLLDAALAEAGLTGVGIEYLSTRHWNAPYVKPKKVANPKHRAQMFELTEGTIKGYAPLSANWEGVTRIPEDTDVYVVISFFDGHDYPDFYRHVRDDRALCEAFGLDFPKVYGYKTSEKKPVDATTLKGTEYRAWRQKLVQDLLTAENLQKIEDHLWQDPSNGTFHRWPKLPQVDKLAKDLGDLHPIVTLLNKQHAAAKGNHAIEMLADRAGSTVTGDTAAHKEWKRVMEMYPLLQDSNLDNLWYRSSWSTDTVQIEHWVDYVKLVDEREARKLHAMTASVATDGQPALALVI